MVNDPFDNYLDLVEQPESSLSTLRAFAPDQAEKGPGCNLRGQYLIERDKLEMFKAKLRSRPAGSLCAGLL